VRMWLDGIERLLSQLVARRTRTCAMAEPGLEVGNR
jgi:hypothetical protein